MRTLPTAARQHARACAALLACVLAEHCHPQHQTAAQVAADVGAMSAEAVADSLAVSAHMAQTRPVWPAASLLALRDIGLV